MANTIITKNSATASAVPTSGQLVQGELAVNVTDKRLFTENSGGTVVELGTNPSQLNFADNAKAIFGAGSDLQIYHDGSNSYIDDVGTGLLNIRTNGAGVMVENTDGTNLAFFDSANGKVRLYHSGSTILDTTSTGIDVTGTVVSDGLTVDGDVSINGTGPKLNLFESDTTDVNTRFRQAGGNLFIETLNDANTAATIRLKVDNSSGDISFFEDTGTTAKFFWDASAESLGIGNAAPATGLHVVSSTGIRAERSGGASMTMVAGSGGEARLDTSILSRVLQVNSNGVIGLRAGSTVGSGDAAFTIDTAGNVGIGESAPAVPLDIKRLSNATIRLNYGAINSNNGEDYYGGIEFFADGTVYGRPTVSAYMRAIHTRAGTGHADSDAGLIFGTSTSSSNAAATERMRIQAVTGYVGINTDTPDAFLEVADSNAGGSNVTLAKFKVVDTSTVTNHLLGIQVSRADKEVIYNSSGSAAGDHVFQTGNIERVRISPNGLSFNGDTGASSSLDDYEEGSFTPTFRDNNGVIGTVASAYGHYVKVGRVCTVWVNLNNIDSTGLTTNTDLRVGDLPFTAVSLTGSIYEMGAGTLTNCSSPNQIIPTVIDSTNYIKFMERVVDNVNDFVLVNELTSGTSDLWATVTYYTIA